MAIRAPAALRQAVGEPAEPQGGAHLHLPPQPLHLQQVPVVQVSSQKGGRGGEAPARRGASPADPPLE
ncbi:MAG: hypothetical protein ROW48_11100 [Bellilinea sp.]